VAASKRAFHPAVAGFELTIFHLDPVRHTVSVVAINHGGRETPGWHEAIPRER
jgi:hypothetical protein